MRTTRRTLLFAAAGAGAAGLAAAPPAVAAAAGAAPWIDVKADHGAAGDGTTDDADRINAALAACPVGGVVLLPPGVYATSVPLVVPPGVTLRGSHGTHLDLLASAIRPLASFTGPAVIRFVDQATGGYPVLSNEQRLTELTVDGSRLPAGNTVAGIRADGYVHGVVLQDVAVFKVGGNGVTAAYNPSGIAYSWRGTRVVANACGGFGFNLSMTDCTWIDLEAIGCGKSGFYVNNAANSHFVSCRAEWNGMHGFEFTGAWTTGNGAGGCSATALSTDRNARSGVLVTATGTGPLAFNGLMLRRDGRNGGGGSGGYAGLQVTGSTLPVVVTGLAVFPGTDDGGAGTSSPQYGLSVKGSSFVSVSGGYLQAAEAPVLDGGGNALLRIDPGLGLATGPTSAPVSADRNRWGASAAYGVAVAQDDRTALALDNSGSNVNQPLVRLQTGTAASNVLKAAVAGEARSRFALGVSGRMEWSDGAGAADTVLQRGGPGVLRTDQALSVGQGLRVGEGGGSARMGTLTLNGTAEVTVPTTAVTARSRVFLTAQSVAGTSATPGVAYVAARTAGVSFGVRGTAGDASVVAWLVVEPA
ncbi:glycosyl hydrolase family 28-related protein [Kitasatospora sp. NPDC096147]|uniref:glycosyl hydrolase family 28-related protein n=1 Tax=Kitasatospora sp. NPDC096147 TaxID=3364093 RepID=UPI0038153892